MKNTIVVVDCNYSSVYWGFCFLNGICLYDFLELTLLLLFCASVTTESKQLLASATASVINQTGLFITVIHFVLHTFV